MAFYFKFSFVTPVLLFFSVGILVYYGNTINGDVVASSAELRMLAKGEGDLIDALKSYIHREQQKLDELERLLAEVETDRGITDGQTSLASIAHHPVDVLHLIHRFTSIWKKKILWIIYDSSAIEEVKAAFDPLREILPTAGDYDDAGLALIRLRTIYELNVDDVTNGTILEQTTLPMTQQMVVDVAMSALNRKMVDEAHLWFTHAQKHLVSPLAPLQDIYHSMSRIHEQKQQFFEADYFAKKALEIDPLNVEFLLKVLAKNSFQKTESTLQLESERGKYLICRQHLVQGYPWSNGALSCFYERGRLTPMLRTKVEMLSKSPEVVIIHDFITDDESAELRRLAKPKMEGARVGNSSATRLSEKRVGKIAWLYDDEGESLVDRISKRISDTTGLETRPPFGEALQMSNYGMGGHYELHHDYFNEQGIDHSRYLKGDLPEDMKEAGDRIATFMIYLNHVEAGGVTIFPHLDLGIKPVKNAAAFWYNYNRSGFPDPLTYHSGCPVLIGEKWVANKWIHEFGQVFRRPCGLSIDL